MADPHVLVDARPISHPTAGGRGIGNYTLGLLHGLAAIDASFTSSPDGFGEVEELSGGQFPVQFPSTGDVVADAEAGANAATMSRCPSNGTAMMTTSAAAHASAFAPPLTSPATCGIAATSAAAAQLSRAGVRLALVLNSALRE